VSTWPGTATSANCLLSAQNKSGTAGGWWSRTWWGLWILKDGQGHEGGGHVPDQQTAVQLGEDWSSPSMEMVLSGTFTKLVTRALIQGLSLIGAVQLLQ
jgi:hypothetical protein